MRQESYECLIGLLDLTHWVEIISEQAFLRNLYQGFNEKWYFVTKIVLTYSHCAFSSNLFLGQIVQIFTLQLSDPKTKNVVLEKFLE